MANHEAAVYRKNQFRTELPYMHLGFWIITGDSHCYASALSDLLQYKVQINNMLKTCDGAAPQCQQCDQFVQDLSTACPQCMTQICNSCHKKSTTFHDDGTSTFKCLKCSHSKTLNHPTSFYHNGKLGPPQERQFRDILLLSMYEKIVGKPPKLHRTIREIFPHVLLQLGKELKQNQVKKIEDNVKHLLENEERRELAIANAIESDHVQLLITRMKKASAKTGAYHLVDDTSCEYGQRIPNTKFVWAWNYNCNEPQLLFTRNDDHYDHVEKVPVPPEDFKFLSENLGPEAYRKMMGLASCGEKDWDKWKLWKLPRTHQRDLSSGDLFLAGVRRILEI